MPIIQGIPPFQGFSLMEMGVGEDSHSLVRILCILLGLEALQLPGDLVVAVFY